MISRIFAASAFFWLAGNDMRAAEHSLLGFQLDKVQNIQGLKVPLGTESNSKPTLSVYFGRITVESKKAGFFRIGPIPQPVVSGMRLEIMEAEGGSTWGTDFLNFAMRGASLGNVEIRGIEIRCPGKESVTVRAEAARFVLRSRTIQLQGVQVQSEGKVLRQFAVGEVYFEGEKAGRLEWNDGGQNRSVLLGPPRPVNDRSEVL